MSDRIRAWMAPLLRWETGLALVVVIIGIAGASVSSEFFTSNNIFNLGLSYGEIAIMTLPMTLIVISGEIDLSVASIAGMSSALLGYLWARHWPMLAIFLLVAVVVGGVAIFGGSGSAVGAALGALLLNTISSALYVLGISPFWNQAIFGFLLLLAITLDRLISVRLTAALRVRGARHE